MSTRSRVLRFLAAAGVGTVCDLGTVMAARALQWPVVCAVAAGWAVSLAVGFALNRVLVFRSTRGEHRGAAIRYAVLGAFNALVAIVGVSWAVSLGAPYLVCRIASSAGLVVFNYLVNRAWVFRSPRSPVPGVPMDASVGWP